MEKVSSPLAANYQHQALYQDDSLLTTENYSSCAAEQGAIQVSLQLGNAIRYFCLLKSGEEILLGGFGVCYLTISPDDISFKQRAVCSHHLFDRFPYHGASPRERAYYSSANAVGWISTV
ncbi:uncharacterized [Tachysurus ichikawai]